MADSGGGCISIRNRDGWDVNVRCTCTHFQFYTTWCLFHLHTSWMLRNPVFLPLAHISMLRNWCRGVMTKAKCRFANSKNSGSESIKMIPCGKMPIVSKAFLRPPIPPKTLSLQQDRMDLWQMTYWNIKHFLIKRNFLIKTKKQNFGRFWQTNLHLQTLSTMVATSNGNVSSLKQS